MDSSGGAVSEVEVTATLEGQTGAPVASVNSTADGRYSLAVPAGRYRVRFVRSPFVTLEQVVDLRPGESRTVNFAAFLGAIVGKSGGDGGGGAVASTTDSGVRFGDHARGDCAAAIGIPAGNFAVHAGCGDWADGAGRRRDVHLFEWGKFQRSRKCWWTAPRLMSRGMRWTFPTSRWTTSTRLRWCAARKARCMERTRCAGVIQVFTHRGETRVPSFGVFARGRKFFHRARWRQMSAACLARLIIPRRRVISAPMDKGRMIAS